MPAVSVIIPAYNSARFLAETIQSVLAQSLQDFELIIVDDGSTDNTRDILAGFSDARIKYFFQSNRGAPAARNQGFQISTGSYILFLDSDDVLLKDTLKISAAVLDYYPEVGFTYGQAWIMNEVGQVYRLRKSDIRSTPGIVDQKQQIHELLFEFLITPSTVMFRRRCFAQVGGFDETLKRLAEDSHLYLRLVKKYSVFYITEPLVKYRFHANQLHKKVAPAEVERAFLKVLGEIFNDLQYAPQFQAWKCPAYFYAYCRVASHAYGKDMALTRHYLRQAVKFCPVALFKRTGLTLSQKYLTSFLPSGLWYTLRDFKWRLKGAPLEDKEYNHA